MGPPFIVVLFLFLLFGLFFAAVGFAVVFIITKILKVRLTRKLSIYLVITFVVLFLFSTIWLRDRQDGVTVELFGGSRYEGAKLSLGLPLVWLSIFEPYDASAQYLFLLPLNLYFSNLLIDFVFWLAISTIVIYVVDFRNKRNLHSNS